MFREDRSWRGPVVHSRARSLSHRFPRGQGKLCATREAAVQDLTTGSLTGHLLRTTSFMLVSMIFQTLYILVDLFWVGRLGTDAIGAVGLAGNLSFIVIAITQVLGVGATTLVSHASGRKDQQRAIFLFNQSQVLSMVAAALFLTFAMLTRHQYALSQAADEG